MDRTPEQDAADRAMEDAISLTVRAYDSVPDGFMVGHWVLVGSAQDPGSLERTSYFRVFSGGSLPAYISLGLLDLGQHLIRNEGWEDED